MHGNQSRRSREVYSDPEMRRSQQQRGPQRPQPRGRGDGGAGVDLQFHREVVSRLQTQLVAHEKRHAQDRESLKKTDDRFNRMAEDFEGLEEENRSLKDELEKLRCQRPSSAPYSGLQELIAALRGKDTEKEGLHAELERLRIQSANDNDTIAKLNNTIAHLGSELNYSAEKDDTFFLDGFAKLEASVRNWVRQNFRGLTKPPPGIASREKPFFLFQTSDNFQEVGGRKEVSCLLQAFVMKELFYSFFKVVHCRIPSKVGQAFIVLDNELEGLSDQFKWRAKTIRSLLKANDHYDVVEKLVGEFYLNIETAIGECASGTSTQQSRCLGLNSLIQLAISLSHENRMLSSSFIEMHWPYLGAPFDPKRMTILGGDDEDGNAAVSTTIQGAVFPEIGKVSCTADGELRAYTLRKAIVLLAESAEPNIEPEHSPRGKKRPACTDDDVTILEPQVKKRPAGTALEAEQGNEHPPNPDNIYHAEEENNHAEFPTEGIHTHQCTETHNSSGAVHTRFYDEEGPEAGRRSGNAEADYLEVDGNGNAHGGTKELPVIL